MHFCGHPHDLLYAIPALVLAWTWLRQWWQGRAFR